MNTVDKLDKLGTAHPEWMPWLCVVREVVAALSSPLEHAKFVRMQAPAGPAPMLGGAALQPDARTLAPLLDRLMRVAHAQGLHAVVGHAPPARAIPSDEVLALFLSAINGEHASRTEQRTLPAGASREGWHSLVQLLPMPYLHACARSWATHGGEPWSQGHCPVCAAWPAFAEVRGIARTRHLRCGRCGAGWAMPALACTYCGQMDHEALGTLVIEDPLARFSVEICHSCSGYLKSCTTLQATAPQDVMVTDLASVAFDLAATERGYFRPPGLGVSLRASLEVDRFVAPQASGWWGP